MNLNIFLEPTKIVIQEIRQKTQKSFWINILRAFLIFVPITNQHIIWD
jgi:hypothetical protein